jgi:DNA-binding beta-propeller fold protein YncE
LAGHISVIDGLNNNNITNILGGDFPSNIALDRGPFTNKIYVTNIGNDSVSIFSLPGVKKILILALGK